MAADGSVIIDTRMDTSGVQNGVSAIRQSFGGLGSVVKKIGVLIGGAFAIGKLAQFGRECVELGSNLSEVQNVSMSHLPPCRIRLMNLRRTP